MITGVFFVPVATVVGVLVITAGLVCMAIAPDRHTAPIASPAAPASSAGPVPAS